MLIWDAHAGFELKSVAELETLSVWKAAGVGFLSVNVGYDVVPWQNTVKALSLARDWLRETDGYRLVESVAEIDEAGAAGDMAVAFDIEGMNALDGSVDMVRFYRDLGVRQMVFAYNLNNAAGGGCHDDDSGLTEFGRAVIVEMNEVGMVIDCSHCGYRTAMEAMESSRDPMVFSHSNARALRDHERNIRDDQAVRCAEIGGVVGVNGINIFVGADDTTTESIVGHIDYYLNLVGAEHVGIGLDYFHPVDVGSGFEETLAGNDRYWPKSQYPGVDVRCAAPSQFAEIAAEMRRRKHPETTIEKVLGGNFRRIAGEVW